MLFELSKGRRVRFFAALFAVAAAVAFDSMIPQATRFMIDNILGDAEAFGYLKNIAGFFGGTEYIKNNIWIFFTVFGCFIIIAVSVFILRRYLGLEFAEYIAKNLRDRLYSHIQKLPFSWHVKNQTGDIIQRSTSDVETLKNFIASDFFDIFRCFCVVSISLSLMLSMDKTMTLSAVALIPVMFLFSFFYYGSIAKKFKEQDEAEGALQASVQENFTGVRVVRAFGREQYEMERFDKKNDHYASKAKKVAAALSNYWGIGDIFCGLQLAAVVTFGIWRCVNDNMTLGTFQTFYAYTSMMIWPVRNLGRSLANFSKAGVSAKRIHEILSEEAEFIQAGEKDHNGHKFESVEFKNVTFKYDENRDILNNVSFILKKGGTLGVLGGTGSGKSTIGYLLTRLYDLNGETGCSGEILIDGENIKNIGLAAVRKNIALVLQEPFLFSKTIKQNIISPNPGAQPHELRRVSEIADIHEAVMEFPEQYDTMVGERGVTLSGGQKQRVAIARMLMQKSPVMIFDDSLSAVDTKTDAKIRAALKQSTAGAAVIIISHRISTLMHSDNILVLRDGAPEDFGTHGQLIKREGTYKRIYDLQSAVAEEYL